MSDIVTEEEMVIIDGISEKLRLLMVSLGEILSPSPITIKTVNEGLDDPNMTAEMLSERYNLLKEALLEHLPVLCERNPDAWDRLKQALYVAFRIHDITTGPTRDNLSVVTEAALVGIAVTAAIDRSLEAIATATSFRVDLT